MVAVWTQDQLSLEIEKVLEANYHHKHPFNIKMHEGQLSPTQLQGWVANRFYYQQMIPVKDCILMSKMPAHYRRMWIARVIYHDGPEPDQGGLEAWLALGDAVGVERHKMLSNTMLLPGVKFATDAYVDFARDKPWIEGVASSLTEMFAHRIMKIRTIAFEQHYPWVSSEGLAYFRSRNRQANIESDNALEILSEVVTTREQQVKVLDAVRFKCQVLWALLDAVEKEYA
ncbi:MAG: pyrroloquinoline-quinone synthase PqqC [Meiothermus sp.]|nr:pyrroloquinoline-quinone synthase PqqC [Meiothermus sp.]